MWDNILIIPSYLALFFFGLGLWRLAILPVFSPNLRKDRTYQVYTSWILFAGMISWLLMAAIGFFSGHVTHGIMTAIQLLVAVALGYETYKTNKYVKTLPRK